MEYSNAPIECGNVKLFTKKQKWLLLNERNMHNNDVKT